MVVFDKNLGWVSNNLLPKLGNRKISGSGWSMGNCVKDKFNVDFGVIDVSGNRIRVNEILDILVKNGFCDRKGKPLILWELVEFEDSIIILYYNKFIYLLYYCFSHINNIGTVLRVVHWILKRSLIENLLWKHKMSRKEFHLWYGSNILVGRSWFIDINLLKDMVR